MTSTASPGAAPRTITVCAAADEAIPRIVTAAISSSRRGFNIRAPSEVGNYPSERRARASSGRGGGDICSVNPEFRMLEVGRNGLCESYPGGKNNDDFE